MKKNLRKPEVGNKKLLGVVEEIKCLYINLPYMNTYQMLTSLRDLIL